MGGPRADWVIGPEEQAHGYLLFVFNFLSFSGVVPASPGREYGMEVAVPYIPYFGPFWTRNPDPINGFQAIE